MTAGDTKHISRRRFLKTAGATALAAGAGPAVIIPGRAQPKTLKFLGVRSFRPALNQLRIDFGRRWGEHNDVAVTVDIIKQSEAGNVVAEAIATQTGYDIIGFGGEGQWLGDEVIDHREIFEECERRYGKAAEFALQRMAARKGDRCTLFLSRF